MPVRPTYEGHFDLTTMGKKMRERENKVPLYAQNINKKSEIWIYATKQKMCSFVGKCFQICMTSYLLRQHRGNQLSRASVGSSVGCCVQKKQAAHTWSVSKTQREIIPIRQKF